VVLNYLNFSGPGPLSVNASASSFSYLDVNADGQSSPIDVLIIVNYLNNPVSGEGESGCRRPTERGRRTSRARLGHHARLDSSERSRCPRDPQSAA